MTQTGNVLAAEIHQDFGAGATSGDRGFDLNMVAVTGLLSNDMDPNPGFANGDPGYELAALPYASYVGADPYVSSEEDPFVGTDELGNDIDGDNFVLFQDGTFQYYPAPNDEGSVTFSYTLRSTQPNPLGGAPLVEYVTIPVTIQIANTGGGANNDSYVTYQDTPLTTHWAEESDLADPFIEGGTFAFNESNLTPGLGHEWNYLPLSSGFNSPKDDYPYDGNGVFWNQPGFVMDEALVGSAESPVRGRRRNRRFCHGVGQHCQRIAIWVGGTHKPGTRYDIQPGNVQYVSVPHHGGTYRRGGAGHLHFPDANH